MDEKYTFADAERLVAQMKADRLKRQSTGPANNADPRQIVAALTAKAEAAKLRQQAAAATAKAKEAAAAITPKPVVRGKQEPMPKCPANLTGQARRTWHRQMETFGPVTAKHASDGILQGLATHDTTSEEDRKTAWAELSRRGWSYSESAKCWLLSHI